MTNRKNKWIKKRRQRLVQEYGDKCEACDSTEELELVHKEPTGLKGRGRGRKERVYDVINNPTKYRLLCKGCHKDYDLGLLVE